MLPIEIIGFLCGISDRVSGHIDKVKANKAQCRRLAIRMDNIASHLKVLQEIPDTQQVRDNLTKLQALFEDIAAFIEKFTKKSWAKRALKGGTYHKRFVDYNEQLEDRLKELHLGLNVQQLMDRASDNDDARADQAALRDNYQEILAANGSELAALQALQEAHMKTDAAHDGLSPRQKLADKPSAVISLDNYKWKKHCRGLFDLPIAA